MPEIEGSNRGILLPNLVMEIGVSVNEDNPKFCLLQKGNLQCAYMNVVFVQIGGRPLSLDITHDGWQDLAREHRGQGADRSWYCMLFRKVLVSQQALTSIPRCQECLDGEKRCHQAAVTAVHKKKVTVKCTKGRDIWGKIMVYDDTIDEFCVDEIFVKFVPDTVVVA